MTKKRTSRICDASNGFLHILDTRTPRNEIKPVSVYKLPEKKYNEIKTGTKER